MKSTNPTQIPLNPDSPLHLPQSHPINSQNQTPPADVPEPATLRVCGAVGSGKSIVQDAALQVVAIGSFRVSGSVRGGDQVGWLDAAG